MLDKYDKGHKNTNKILNDNLSDSDFYQFLLAYYTNMARVLKPGGAFYIFHADVESINFRSALKAAGMQVRQGLVWVKSCLVLGRQDYQWRHEPILYGWKDGSAHCWYGGRKQDTILDLNKMDLTLMPRDDLVQLVKDLHAQLMSDTTTIYEDKPTTNEEHPTMKPVKLLGRLIKNSSELKEIVLDNFGGSGSTLIACEQLGRTCYMSELDPAYCDVIIKRWEKFTEQKAVLINERPKAISV